MLDNVIHDVIDTLLELLSTFMFDFKVGYASLTVVLDRVQCHSLIKDKINVSCFIFVEDIPNISIVHYNF